MLHDRAPVVQPHLDVYHRQGCLGRHGVGHPHQELQHVRAEHLGADWIGLSGIGITILKKLESTQL